MADEVYNAMFNRFFNSVRMSSTYKPVFLKALLDVGDLYHKPKTRIVGGDWLNCKNDRLFVKLDFIAVRFAQYYWILTHKFKLRQSQDPGDANILKTISDARDSNKNPPTLKALSHERMSEFRATVIRESINREVLVHLKKDMPDLYKKESSTEISLDKRIVKYAHENKKALEYGLNYVIATYLEKINPNTPNVAKKVGHNPNRVFRPKLCDKAVGAMCKWQNSSCFYCGRKFTKHHVDHVIPFNFVFSTNLYNCVLACPHCNCKKSDMLPAEYLFTDVVNRNHKRSYYIKKQRTAYDEGSYRLLFNTCKFEYNNALFKPT